MGENDLDARAVAARAEFLAWQSPGRDDRDPTDIGREMDMWRAIVEASSPQPTEPTSAARTTRSRGGVLPLVRLPRKRDAR